MDSILIILAVLLSFIGIIGSVIPGLPGHPLNYIAMLIVQWVYKPYTTTTIILFGILTVLVVVLDYFIPIWTAKKYGATKQGIIGSIIGMFIGMIFTPIGMIMGVLLGAIIGDLIAGKMTSEAIKSGAATLFGTVLSIGLKLITAVLISSLIVYDLIKLLF